MYFLMHYQPYGELEVVHGIITVFESNSFAAIIFVQTIGQEPKPFGKSMDIVFTIITEILTVMINLLQNCKS